MQDAPPAVSTRIARSRSIKADTEYVLIEALRAAGGRQVLDCGCGEGQMAATLSALGFAVTGIDPSESALRKARAAAPGARFLCAGADSLPPGIGPFDAGYFLNSLHHVPAAKMDAALQGTLDVLRPDAPLLVIEPLPFGSFFRAMRPIEDEMATRLQAVSAVETLIASGRAELHELRRWDRESHFRRLSEFTACLLRADAGRAAAIRANAQGLARAWRANIQFRDGYAVLVQPLICWTLVARRSER